MTFEKVKGKTIIFTTSSGTKLMKIGIRKSKKLLVGALINYKACADIAKNLASEGNADIKILIPRTKQGECIEDLYAAGLIAKRLSNQGLTPEWDFTTIAILLAGIPEDQIIDKLRKSMSAKRIGPLGYIPDIEYSLNINSVPKVPISKDFGISL